jgi:hypothetical protein
MSRALISKSLLPGLLGSSITALGVPRVTASAARRLLARGQASYLELANGFWAHVTARHGIGAVEISWRALRESSARVGSRRHRSREEHEAKPTLRGLQNPTTKASRSRPIAPVPDCDRAPMATRNAAASMFGFRLGADLAPIGGSDDSGARPYAVSSARRLVRPAMVG